MNRKVERNEEGTKKKRNRSKAIKINFFNRMNKKLSFLKMRLKKINT